MRLIPTAGLVILLSLFFVVPQQTLAQSSVPKFGEVNMGTTDRLIRTGLGVGLAAWGAVWLYNSNSNGYIPLAISAVPFLTAATGRCLLYYPLGIDTRENKQAVSLDVVPSGLALHYHYNF